MKKLQRNKLLLFTVPERVRILRDGTEKDFTHFWNNGSIRGWGMKVGMCGKNPIVSFIDKDNKFKTKLFPASQIE